MNEYVSHHPDTEANKYINDVIDDVLKVVAVKVDAEKLDYKLREAVSRFEKKVIDALLTDPVLSCLGVDATVWLTLPRYAEHIRVTFEMTDSKKLEVKEDLCDG